MAVGEVFLSAFLQVLFDRLASRDFLELLRVRKYDGLLEKLKITLLSVTVLLNDAETKQFSRPAVEKWLHMAKDGLYDAEDILDELATEALKCKLEAEAKTSSNQVTNLISYSFNSFGRGTELKIRKCIEKLELIAKYKDVLGLKDDGGDGRGLYGAKYRLPTTSLVDESCVYGLDSDKEIVIKLLLKEEQKSSKVDVVPIVGMGGVGKTTLAQVVYNDKRVKDHFDSRIWVWVSDQFDLVKVTAMILNSLTSETVALDNLNQMLVCLKDKLEGKRFLLVLDDVWSKRDSDWDLLWNPLKAAANGSKIIVTTRNSKVASRIGTVPAHDLRGLSFEDGWSLFMSRAFENGNINNGPNLETVGRQIVERCQGLPLAVKRMGTRLRSRQEEDEWLDVLNKKIWELPDDESDVFQTLGLSYVHLPAHLKQCFAYCSLFPAEYEFEMDSLVLLWMAEGFVQQPKGQKRLEEIGGEYFNELVSSSFFQQSTQNNSRFVMHGLMKELAQFVSGEFCFRLEDKLKDGNQNGIFEKARHSSYIRSKRDVLSKFEAFNGVEFLRTFLPLDPIGRTGVSYLSNKVPHDLLPKLRYLRALSFNACRITELPDSIGDLEHLRYLDLSCTAIKRLPDSTSTLYNLQTLILLQCRSLARLPAEMGRLTGLRHLRISESRLRKMPKQMGRLKNLQTLSHFVVGKNSRSGIRELRNMLQLQGSLLISGLQNVVSFADAVEANLKNKKELDQLIFQWSNSFDDLINYGDEEEALEPQLNRSTEDLGIRGRGVKRIPSFREYMQEPVELKLGHRSVFDDSRNERVETDVLEMLQPHKNIKQLTIKDYYGTKFPSWIGSPLFSNLTSLKFSNCKKCEYLPPLGQLPSLKNLSVEGMGGINRVGVEFYGNRGSSTWPFPMLENLKFENMPEWEEWCSSGVEGMEDFHNLQKIEILNCPRLREFPCRFPSLTKMSIKGCEELTAFPRLLTLNSFEQGREFPSLFELSIWKCPKLRELPDSFPCLTVLEIDSSPELAAVPKLPSIRELELRKCDGVLIQSLLELTSLTYLRLCQISNLTSLIEGFFENLTALEELQITHLSELTSLSNEIGLQNLPFLQRLEISGCPHLMELPQSLHKLSSLKELRVLNCPSLMSFPGSGLPSSLSGLEIKDCAALQLLPEWRMSNSESLVSLEYLTIEGCASLRSFPRGGLPSTLKKLEIQNCKNLESLPEEMIHTSKFLEFLKISGCHSVRSFPLGTFWFPAITFLTVMNLKQLIINNCAQLEALPEGLNNLIYLDVLDVADCPCLLSFPEPGLPISTLRSVRISNCNNLKSLPDRMYMLTSLQELRVDRCSSLVSFPEGGLPTNLMSLLILDCENLKPSYEWGLHKLTDLIDFSYGGCQKLVSFPEDWLLPANISSFCLQRMPNLKSLPSGFKDLRSLETLEIWECDSLQTLPKEGPPTMLLSLWDAL